MYVIGVSKTARTLKHPFIPVHEKVLVLYYCNSLYFDVIPHTCTSKVVEYDLLRLLDKPVAVRCLWCGEKVSATDVD